MGIGVPTGGAQLVRATSSQGTAPAPVAYTPGFYHAELGDLAVGASATVTVLVTPTAAGPLTAGAGVGSDLADPNYRDNTAMATATVVPPAADLAIALVASPTT